PIFARGDAGGELLIVERGAVRIFLPAGDNGEEIVLAIVREAEFFGELAILGDEPRSASAAALTDATLLSLRRAQFRWALERHPEAAYRIISLLAQRLQQADSRAMAAAFLDVLPRVAAHLGRLAAQTSERSGPAAVTVSDT